MRPSPVSSGCRRTQPKFFEGPDRKVPGLFCSFSTPQSAVTRKGQPTGGGNCLENSLPERAWAFDSPPFRHAVPVPYKDPEQQRAAQARYYRENQERIQLVKNRKRNLARRRVQEIKESTPCADCGIQYPYYVMDFDHRPGTGKMFDISDMGLVSSVEVLLAEVAKCDVVCANCHRHRTFMRKVEILESQPVG